MADKEVIKRGVKWIEADAALLVDVYAEFHPQLSLGFDGPPGTDRKQKKTIWAEVSAEFNKRKPAQNRRVEEIAKKIDNLKQLAKKAIQTERQAAHATGGGSPPPQLPMSVKLFANLLMIYNKTATVGIENGVESQARPESAPVASTSTNESPSSARVRSISSSTPLPRALARGSPLPIAREGRKRRQYNAIERERVYQQHQSASKTNTNTVMNLQEETLMIQKENLLLQRENILQERTKLQEEIEMNRARHKRAYNMNNSDLDCLSNCKPQSPTLNSLWNNNPLITPLRTRSLY